MNKRDCEKLKHSLSVIVANALMRKRASRVKEKVELSHTLADRLKSAYGISGRFRQTDLFDSSRLSKRSGSMRPTAKLSGI